MRIELPAMMKKIKMNNKLKNKIIKYQILIESITIISSSNTSDKLIIIEIWLPSMMKQIKIINKLKNKIIKYQKTQKD